MKKLFAGLLLALALLTVGTLPLEAQSTTVTHKVIVRLWHADGPWVEFYYTNPTAALAKLYEISDANPVWDNQAAGVRGHRGSFLVFGSCPNGGQAYDDLATATSPAGARKTLMAIDAYKKRFGLACTISVPKSSQVHSVFIVEAPFPAPFAP